MKLLLNEYGSLMELVRQCTRFVVKPRELGNGHSVCNILFWTWVWRGSTQAFSVNCYRRCSGPHHNGPGWGSYKAHELSGRASNRSQYLTGCRPLSDSRWWPDGKEVEDQSRGIFRRTRTANYQQNDHVHDWFGITKLNGPVWQLTGNRWGKGHSNRSRHVLVVSLNRGWFR